MWTDGEYRNLSKDPEAQHIAYRVEIVSSEALSDAVKAAITDTAEGCELSRVGQQLFVVGTFDDQGRGRPRGGRGDADRPGFGNKSR